MGSFKIILVILLAMIGRSAFAAQTNPFRDILSGIVNGKALTMDYDITKRVAYILFTKADGHQALCTGTILPQHIILTAAHCVGKTMSVSFTPHYDEVGSVAVTRRVTLTAVNPLYTAGGMGKFENDVALLKFEGLLPPGYAGLPVPGASIDIAPSENMWMVGYGRSSPTNSDYGTLRWSYQPASRMIHYSNLHSGMIEIDQHDHGACLGDSGGPLLVMKDNVFQIVGVFSTVYNPNHPESEICNGFATYSGTEANGSWIRQMYQEMIR